MFRESAMVIDDNGAIVDCSVGSAGHVDFNFFKVWSYWVRNPDKQHKLRFFHVHPRGFLAMSDVDVNCIRGFAMSLGINIDVFGIICFNSDKLDDLSHQLAVFSCDKYTQSVYCQNFLDRVQESPLVLEDANNKLIPDNKLLAMLKELSYSDKEIVL